MGEYDYGDIIFKIIRKSLIIIVTKSGLWNWDKNLLLLK